MASEVFSHRKFVEQIGVVFPFSRRIDDAVNRGRVAWHLRPRVLLFFFFWIFLDFIFLGLGTFEFTPARHIKWLINATVPCPRMVISPHA
jgi:hypothetical protein